jgi:uncharacterized protein (TIGR03067 family)
VRSVWEFRLDPTATPRRIDRTSLGTEYVERGNFLRGIYRFDGDKLTICYAQNKGSRPTEFDSGTRDYLMVLTRAGR